jgi:hypothetical protein
MLLIGYLLYKNHIFNNVRCWGDRHFVDILQLKNNFTMQKMGDS